MLPNLTISNLIKYEPSLIDNASLIDVAEVFYSVPGSLILQIHIFLMNDLLINLYKHVIRNVSAFVDSGLINLRYFSIVLEGWKILNQECLLIFYIYFWFDVFVRLI